jgi:CDP-glucose 4,6-dehydratase
MSNLQGNDSNFWTGKKVFLTGHTGFKGSWAAIWLHSLGAKVFGYSLPAPTQPSLYQKANISNLLIGEEIGDICDSDKLGAAMLDFQPELVLHMAAQPLVRYSYDHPVETYMTNVMGTVQVLESIRRTKSVRATLVVTTDKCYENFEVQDGYKEENPMGGYDPYSSSKGCAELVVSAWRRSYFTNSETFIASARAGNVIGGGDWASDRLIPDFMKHFSVGKKVLVRSPGAIRPWQHVMEPLSGYFLLLEKLYTSGAKFAEAWNFGPHDRDARDVRFIADKLMNLWGDGASWGLDDKQHPHEAKYLKLAIDKAIYQLGWQPTFDINETLKLTCEWYKEFYKFEGRAFEVTLEQIKLYEERKKAWHLK